MLSTRSLAQILCQFRSRGLTIEIESLEQGGPNSAGNLNSPRSIGDRFEFKHMSADRTVSIRGLQDKSTSAVIVEIIELIRTLKKPRL